MEMKNPTGSIISCPRPTLRHALTREDLQKIMLQPGVVMSGIKGEARQNISI